MSLPASGEVPVAPVPSTSAPVTAVPVPSKPAQLPAALKTPVKENPFVYLGIPQWVFDYRPKPPSRNMSIFLSVTIGLTSAYIYDRRECKRIQKEYVHKVKWMGELPLDAREMPRRLQILAAVVPEDGELDRPGRWFKRYIRPYLVASGTDYIITEGTTPGGLGRTLQNEIRSRRLAEASNDAAKTIPGAGVLNTAIADRDAVLDHNALDGGLVVMGRGALKEYLWALRKGYGEEIDVREEARLEGLGLGAGDKRKGARTERYEELVVKELEIEDAENPKAPFDAHDEAPHLLSDDDGDSENPAAGLVSIGYVPYSFPPPSASSNPPSSSTPEPIEQRPIVLPPAPIPPQPPLLLVPFTHSFGAQRWPAKLVHFFNYRSDVKEGAEYAMMVINGTNTRSLQPPVLRNRLGELEGVLDEKLVSEMRLGKHSDLGMGEGTPMGSPDLDLLIETEEPYHYRRSYRKLPSVLEFQRREYYTTTLPPRLKQARELASGRTPTKAEANNPPKIESELRKERLEKEVRWRHQLQGWAVRRSGSGLAWDEMWGSGRGHENVFRVFREVDQEEMRKMEAAKVAWEDAKALKEAELDAL